ncbi:MAG TPA: PRC-barrel domain-containing protein [Candidatus Borkfalkia stercoripullorum]|nr:PRC-barrel domain-containing protein [Candidatus Borkfalkia stercoripullorum]
MQRLSDCIGKNIFTKSGENAGTVKNALLSKNLKTVRAFEYFDDREDEHELPASSVISVQDALIVKSLAERQYKDAVPAPFGMQAYSETGESLGNVCDFLTENGEVRALLLTGGQEIEAARIASVKDALFFDLTSPLPLKQKKSAPARKRPSPEGGSPAPSQEGRPAAQPREAARPAAVKPKAGSALLTGKRVPADVCDVRGNVIVKKDTVVTADVLKRAMTHNKLFELTLCVLSESAAN